MAAKPKTKTPVRRRKEARPAELLAAALELFVERGFTATKLEDVAARAGVSKGTLYLYFSSKEALFTEVIRQGVLPVVDEGETMMQQHSGDAAALLRGLIYRWWELMGKTNLSAIPKLIIAEAGNFPETAQFFNDHVVQRIDQLLASVLKRGMDSGEFRRVDIGSTVDMITAPILMRVIWQHSIAPCCGLGQQDDDIYLQTCLDLLLNGLSTQGISHE